jgi:hypothetical protein
VTEESPAPAVAAGAPTTEQRRRRRWPWVTAFSLTFVLVVAAGAFAGATVSYADSLEGRLLPGTTIAGRDVGGLTQAQALKQVKAGLADELRRTIRVGWGDRSWATKARALGAHSNARKIIAQVAASQEGVTWQEWTRLRWFGDSADVAESVNVKYRRAAVRQFIGGIAEEVERDPVDSELVVDGEDVVITSPAQGYAVDQDHAVRKVLHSLHGGGRPVALRVRTLDAAVTEEDFSQVLLLDQSEHRLTLHLGGVQTHEWIVATGTGDYPTPLGTYHVELKRYLPTWVNPSPDGWGKDMPDSIPPGPRNPLGVRALNWNAPAIRFHGTQALDSLGTDASHGCVRMSNADVTELYDLVDVGAIIISQE